MKNPKKFYMCPRHQGGGQKSRNRLMPRRFRLGSEAINIPNPIRERKRRKHCAENGRRCGSCSDRLTLAAIIRDKQINVNAIYCVLLVPVVKGT